MRHRFRSALLLTALIAVAVALPAAAEQWFQMPFHNTRATPIPDSLTVSLFTGARDTTNGFGTAAFPSATLASLDTSFALTAAGHAKNALAVIVEVTGAINADADSLYLAYDYNENRTTPRWYLGKDFVAAVPNQTSSATFIWLLPADPSDKNSWIWHDQMRFRLGGPGTGTSVALGSRLTLSWRSQ